MRFEDLADEAFGRPIRHPHASARPRDAQQLGCGPLGARSEHRPEHRARGVEPAAPVRQLLGVTDVHGDRKRFRDGARPCLRDEVGSDVDPGNASARAGSWDREIARSASDVEDSIVRPELEPRHKFGGAGDVA